MQIYASDHTGNIYGSSPSTPIMGSPPPLTGKALFRCLFLYSISFLIGSGDGTLRTIILFHTLPVGLLALFTLSKWKH